MRISGPDGQSFELRILGYQYPDLETAEYDSNWLCVEGRVEHPRGGWTFQDPSLLTYEASELADWLDSVADGSPASDEIGFIEPNLSMSLVRSISGLQVRVCFALEARPPWALSEAEEIEEAFVDVPADPDALREAAAELREQLKDYPKRAAF